MGITPDGFEPSGSGVNGGSAALNTSMPALTYLNYGESASTIDIGEQTFLGLTVVDFNCNSSWDQQGGQCTINLIQSDGQYLSEEAVVGSPKYFEIVSNNNVPIFRFYGILKTVSRSVSDSKIYTAVIQSPTILLSSCSVITDVYPGYGGALEAYGPNVPTCLDFGNYNNNLSPSNVFNVQNVFGVYENDSFGATGAGFGRSAVNSDGIRIDLFANAINALLNGDASLTPTLGGNIVYGSNSYTLSGNKAYAYNFDILSFLNQIAAFIPNDFRVRPTDLMQFVADVCEAANHIFYVDLLKPSTEGSQYFSSGHISTTTPNLTYSNTIYGGQIVILTQNRNTFSSIKFPLSRDVITKEASDKLGGFGQTKDLPLDIGVSGALHPDGPPVASMPYGGSYPVEDISLDSKERYSSTNIEISLTENAVGAKYITGGYQSRINYISTLPNNDKPPEITGSTCSTSPPSDSDISPDVYCYWGEINIAGRLNLTEDSNIRNVPVITPFLWGPYEYLDFILIDTFDISGNTTIGSYGDSKGAMFNGIYPCSLRELRHAMAGYESWLEFMMYNKYGKVYAIESFFSSTTNSAKMPLFTENGDFTYAGVALNNAGLHYSLKYNTSSSNVYQEPSCGSDQVGAYEFFMKSLHEKISKIGQDHYGKSYAVKMPAFSVKADSEDQAPVNSFIKSWDISSDAYLDPPNYYDYEAPNGKFVNNGRVSAYANYKAVFNVLELPFGPSSSVLSYNLPSISNYDMSEFSKDEIVTQFRGFDTLNSVPINVNQEYLLIPNPYLITYSLLSIPLYEASKDRINLRPQIVSSIEYLINLRIDENGFGCTPFALVTTNRVFPPRVVAALEHLAVFNTSPEYYVEDLVGNCEGATNSKKSIDSGYNADSLAPFPVVIPPKSFGIPQQSNRYVYGPWTTQTNVPYGVKIEYEQITDLVPENYVLPVDININGVDLTLTSGYAGMDLAGQLLANSVANFDYLFTEQASVTIPGYPKITNLGKSLVENGPLVSDISVSISASRVETQYNMKTFAPKFGRANEYIVRRLNKFSQKFSRINK